MSNIQDKVTGFQVISTNDANIILDDNTRDDIISIIEELKKISGLNKLSEILELFESHISLYNKVDPLDYRYDLITKISQLLTTTIDVNGVIPSVNPHNTKIEYLVGNILDKLYGIWLQRGNSASMDELRQVIFNVMKHGSSLDIFNGSRDDLLISAKEFRDYVTNFHEQLLTTYHKEIFVVSQQDLNWPGELHGLKIYQDQQSGNVYLTKEDLYANVWYTCSVDVSTKFLSADVYVDILADTEMTVKYRLTKNSAWIPLVDSITVDVYNQTLPDGTTINILDSITYRHRLPTMINTILQSRLTSNTDLRVTVELYIEPKTASLDIFNIYDIIVNVDGTDRISDDIYKKEFYADIPHKAILGDFLDIVDAAMPVPVYTCFNHLYTPDDSFIINKVYGSMVFSYQPVFDRLAVVSSDVVSGKFVQPLIDMQYNDISMFDISTVIIGDRVTIGSGYKYTKINNMYLCLNKDGVEYPLVDITTSHNRIHTGVLTYLDENNVIFNYVNKNGILVSDILTLSTLVNGNVLVKPKFFLENTAYGNIVGLHRFSYYNTILSKDQITSCFMHTKSK